MSIKGLMEFMLLHMVLGAHYLPSKATLRVGGFLTGKWRVRRKKFSINA